MKQPPPSGSSLVRQVTLAGKLQLRAGQCVAVLQMPAGIDLDLEPAERSDDPAGSDAVLLFIRRAGDLASGEAEATVAAAKRDALAWVAYPKGGQLDTDVNRDSLAELLEARDVRPVRQVAIDDVWSALRFRPRG